ncbi:GTPase HflX [candidate division KSB1 bacterium]
MYITQPEREKVVLIGTVLPKKTRSDAEETLAELSLLAESAGTEVVEKFIQKLQSFDPAFFIGKGKAEQISAEVNFLGADTVIFDDDLSPAQMKNLEKVLKKKIIDRTGLILEIFAQNAQTREAKTQVELAHLEYLLPRLTRQWVHLERQIGGIGVRGGMGETQLEVDRRLTRKRIRKLKEQLVSIENQRNIRKKGRRDRFKATLIGYTNAGKSTLFNSLTESKVLTADRLFATLDSTMRRLSINSHKEMVLLADTVGFIRKLPHNLIASFRSTFGVVRDADLLLAVIDISYPNYEEHIDAVNTVLKEMGLSDKPLRYIFNKIDLLEDEDIIKAARRQYKNSEFISASRGIGLRKVLESISDQYKKDFLIKEYTLDISDTKTIADLYNTGHVLDQKYNGELTTLKVRLSLENAAKLNYINNIQK